MKIRGKLITFLFSMFLLLFVMPMTAKADELPPTWDGKEVVLTDFEILKAKTTYYDFESKTSTYEFYEDMLNAIDVKGMQYKICYTVDGVEYESIGTIDSDSNDEYGLIPEQPGIAGAYDGLNIFVSWKKYSTKEIDGQECYVVDRKNNALVCKCGDMVVELPVKTNVPNPVKEITILNNPWEDGIYGYKYEETIGAGDFDFSGLKIKITYSDGREADIVEWTENGIVGEPENGYDIIISEELSDDGVLGVDVKSTIVTVFYMGVRETFEVPLIQNPIKKMELTKNPKKMVYDVVNDVPDLYGATLKITYHDGTKETIKIKSHKTEIFVDNKYNDSIELKYYGSGDVWVKYLGETLIFRVPTDISKLGTAKAITAGKSKTETLKADAPTRLYLLTAKKTGRYQMDFCGEGIRLKSGGKGNKRYTDFTVYVLDENGYCKRVYNRDGDDEGIIGLTKGEKYYFYIYIDEDQYYRDASTPLYKHKFTSKITYLGGLEEQTITASDIKKKYGEDSFFMEAKAESGAELTYSSSNKKVATITKDGEVKIKGIGTTEITINAPAAGIYKAAKKTITLTVTKGDANLKVENTSYTKALGSKAFKLGATAETDITYKSSNTKVATVNSKGKVTIKGCGKAVITITAGDEKYKKATKKVTIQVTPKKAAIKTAKSKKAGQLTVTWNKRKEAKGYVIEYSTDKEFKKGVKTVTIKKNGTVTKTLKSLKKGTVYYVKVKAYIEIDGKKVYGESSKVKRVTVK